MRMLAVAAVAAGVGAHAAAATYTETFDSFAASTGTGVPGNLGAAGNAPTNWFGGGIVSGFSQGFSGAGYSDRGRLAGGSVSGDHVFIDRVANDTADGGERMTVIQFSETMTSFSAEFAVLNAENTRFVPLGEGVDVSVTFWRSGAQVGVGDPNPVGGTTETFTTASFSGLFDEVRITYYLPGGGVADNGLDTYAMDNVTVTTIPLPTAAGTGLAGLAFLGARRRRA